MISRKNKNDTRYMMEGARLRNLLYYDIKDLFGSL